MGNKRKQEASPVLYIGTGRLREGETAQLMLTTGAVKGMKGAGKRGDKKRKDKVWWK